MPNSKTKLTGHERTEQQLAESRNFLERIINTVSDPIFVKDRQHRGVLVNDAFCQLVGFKREELLGKSDHDHDCFTRAQADEFRSKDELVFATGKENVNEETITAADGTLHLVITKKALYTDETGEKFIVGVIHDITEQQRASEALRESEANYYSLVDQMPAGIFRKDEEGRYVFVNSAFCQVMGMSAEDILGKTAPELLARMKETGGASRLVSDKQNTQGISHHESIMRTGRPIAVEDEYLGADGGRSYYHTVKSPVFDADGKVVGSQGILFNVTGRKLAEAALQQERNLLRTLIDRIPDNIYVRDLSNRFVVANESFARLMGAAGPSALIGKQDADFYPPEIAATFDKIDQEVFAGRHILNRERVVLFPNGQELTMLNTKVPLKNDKGEVIGLIGVGRDVTESKRAEAVLATEQRLLSSLITATPDIIYFKNLEGRFIRSNEAFARKFGLSGSSAALSKTDFDIFGEEHAREAQADERRIISTGEPVIDKEEREDWKDGRVTWVSSTKMPLRDNDGKIVGIMGISRDITERKRLEEHLIQSCFVETF